MQEAENTLRLMQNKLKEEEKRLLKSGSKGRPYLQPGTPPALVGIELYVVLMCKHHYHSLSRTMMKSGLSLISESFL